MTQTACTAWLGGGGRPCVASLCRLIDARRGGENDIIGAPRRLTGVRVSLDCFSATLCLSSINTSKLPSSSPHSKSIQNLPSLNQLQLHTFPKYNIKYFQNLLQCLTRIPPPYSPTSTPPLALPRPFSATSQAAMLISNKAKLSKTKPKSRMTPRTSVAASLAIPPQAAAL